ncbi:unnamed protein product [Ceutorhynchus assimilis]|uniref:Uncharacterized protein n=1 Tax=Ceutorhynchus assimilis TaxID=467358 RepID=A0A9N9MX73_9CUCU|nr:unnamed protein product [Ceutorhynchus assimilis]
MVTSAFDGTVYAWNLKEQTENNMLFEKVFLMNGLMRMKLTPDGTKMIISTTSGFMVIIHNLNLLSLATDLQRFRPNLYRLMQTSEQCFPIATTFNHLFSQSKTRNRIEFIDDFPNNADVISSLQIHPHGWSAVSRNLNDEENEEWTAVHDIQTRDPKEYEDAFMYGEEEDEDEEVDAINELEGTPEGRPIQTVADLWMNLITVEELPGNDANTSLSVVNSGLIGPNPSFKSYFKRHPNEKNKIIKNIPRMTHYAKERNVGKGFIKGLTFSSDGRVICSPYDKGFRLLGFSETCQEISDCVPAKPQQLLTILEMNDYHRDIVVSSKFSPTHFQLVTGCLGSEIKWYQPKL